MDKQLVSTFMEVTSCESQADAVRHLGSCHWNLDEAINLYFSNDLPEENAATEPSGSSADPILPSDENVSTKEYKDHGDAAIDGDFEDDVRAPFQYYGDRSTAVVDDAPFNVEVSSLSLGEIVPTGWGEAEADDAGETRVENVDGNQKEAHDDDDAEQQDDNSTKEDDYSGGNGEEGYGAEYNDDEDYDNMSYIDEEEQDDDDDAYYSALAEDTDRGRPAVQPPPHKAESLTELFRLPHELMCRGSFHGVKVHAARKDRFLLVNLQMTSDFPSQIQNRDLWSDELVKRVVGDSFVFFLLQKQNGGDDAHVDQGAKLASFYRLQDGQLPAVLVVDPITGQLLARRSGTMTPDEFVQFVGEYVKSKPSAMSMPKFVKKTPPAPAVLPAPVGDAGGEPDRVAYASYAAAVEQKLPPPAVPESPAATADDEVGEQEQEIPENSAAAGAGGDCSEQEPVPVPNNNATDELPAEILDVDDEDDEPMEDEEMYKLRIRFPDGTVVDKEFGCKRRVASLFAFCRSALHGGGQHAAAEEKKAIRIMRFAGRALVAMHEDDDAGATFEDLGLNFAAVSVVFDA